MEYYRTEVIVWITRTVSFPPLFTLRTMSEFSVFITCERISYEYEIT